MIKQSFLERLISVVEAVLLPVFSDANIHCSEELDSMVSDVNQIINNSKDGMSEEELNSLFVARAYATAVSKYLKTITLIVDGKFAESWNILQDSADAIMIVKRFSEHDIHYLEERVVSLERMYPYNVFFSAGAVAKPPKCSICGEVYDSSKCSHLAGELYGGIMAGKIIEEIIEVEEVSFVDNPVDRRCVEIIQNESQKFKPLKSLSDFIVSNNLPAGAFLSTTINNGHLRINLDTGYLPRDFIAENMKKHNSETLL